MAIFPHLAASTTMEQSWSGTCAHVYVIIVLFHGLCTNMSTATEAITELDAPDNAVAFIQEHERTIRPLERAAALAWWNANVSGRDQDFKAKEDAQNRLDAALSDPCAL